MMKIIIAIAALTLLAGGVQANTVTRDTKGDIYITGVAEPIEVIFTGAIRRRAIVTDSCGVLAIKPTKITAVINVENGQNDVLEIASLRVALRPKCAAGSLQVPVSGKFKTPDGVVILTSQTPSSAIYINYKSEASKRVAGNSCGIGVIRIGATIVTTFIVGSKEFNYDSLDLKLPDICREGVLYAPKN
jgi:hypothetical protein